MFLSLRHFNEDPSPPPPLSPTSPSQPPLPDSGESADAASGNNKVKGYAESLDKVKAEEVVQVEHIKSS